MSGNQESDITLFLRGLREWALPETIVVDLKKQESVETALRQWLASRGLRTVFDE